MFILQTPQRRRSKEEAEKPFWISFSDLMTALMVLFLVAMAVALMVVTQGLRSIEDKRKDWNDSITAFLGRNHTQIVLLFSTSPFFIFLSQIFLSPTSCYPISSGIGLPWSTIGVGRPLKSRIRVLAESIPR